MSQSGRSLTNSPPPPCLAPVRSPSHTNDSICPSVRWEPFSPGQMRPVRQNSRQRAHQGSEFLTGLRYLWDLRWNQILNLAPDSPWSVGEILKYCVCFWKRPHPKQKICFGNTLIVSWKFYFCEHTKCLKCFFFLGYVNVKEIFHFIIFQTIWECCFWMFSEHSEISNIKKNATQRQKKEIEKRKVQQCTNNAANIFHK